MEPELDEVVIGIRFRGILYHNIKKKTKEPPKL